ncbi:hypothetical protein [Brevibacillus fulvus]|uniref:3-hydroxymyristoyl/3-hydroxydecanoyl-(Acyl carrier protein) dehydratase n=1 Tax=Brevibacillus fulvus TaxID=1125967 RepID=A0A938Y0X2_9BACL|nr:hypothetical protein [Brevibacillus fulvus]MBM7589557.1 3-hydroxymyristoyl/3-hydroxydecanoyl-(acyl carrier protein) dehydratase [Brevibacillus fulvus]
MNWGLIDKVVEWSAGKEAAALQNIGMTSPILDTHFPLKPIWPGVLTMSAVIRLAAGVLESAEGFARKVELSQIANVKWRKYISPGDQLRIDVQVLSLDEAGAVVKGKVSVGNRPVATFGEMTFRFVEGGQANRDRTKMFWQKRGYAGGGEA